jgi:predicted hydrocarbon binding protein
MTKTKNELPKRLSAKQIFEAAKAIWLNQPIIAEDVASKASKMIQSTFEAAPMFFSGKSSKRILSGLFYQLSLNTVNAKTQREIASALGTTEMTTRMSYREWSEKRLDVKEEDPSTCKPWYARLKSLVEQAEYDADKAEIRIADTDWILMRSSTFRAMIAGAEKVLGSAAAPIWREIAKHAGRGFAEELLEGGTDPEEVPAMLEAFFTQGGWGMIRSKIDLTKKEGVIRIENCATARESKSNEPVCHFVSGFISGVADAILGEATDCSETKCMAQGDAFCEFKVERPLDREHLSI